MIFITNGMDGMKKVEVKNALQRKHVAMSDDVYRIVTTNVRSTLIPKGCTVRRCSRKGNELHEST